MANAVEHRSALLRRTLDTSLHLNESVARLPDLACAMRIKVEVSSLAKILRRLREAQNRSNLVAQKDDRERQEEDHRPQHPEDENVSVRLIGKSSAGHQTEHSAPEIDAYLHQTRPPDSV